MAQAPSKEIRDRVVAAVEAGATHREASERLPSEGVRFAARECARLSRIGTEDRHRRRRPSQLGLGHADGPRSTDKGRRLPGLFGATLRAEHADARPLIPDAAPQLPAMPGGEAIARDYGTTGLTLRNHPLALLRPVLRRLRCDDSRTLAQAAQGRRVRVPGLTLMRQQPMTAKGVIFVTIEDEFGMANVVVYTHISTRDRVQLLTSRLMLVEGRVEREAKHAEVPIVHLIASRIIDRSDLLDQLSTINDQEDGAWAERMLGRADEVKRPEPGSRRLKVPRTGTPRH
ncbi:hypothetical protein GXW78_25570 [Roseomonas terrae]|uniref:OB domain-containing protein n=1 Tax=Neoroseomonas terrae TaxID=424799 RepID=A0ABS5EPU2_9PROT|nr:hypothetical protein [Neoroseomonas terrae]MBR0653051.1 hypothetical protein [Neoroseomonas terrae]